MMNANELVVMNTARPSADPEDMFAELDELDPFELKKDEVAAQLAALMSFAKKNRSALADSLKWKKSRMTCVLSGKGNPTIKTIWEFCSSLGFDFDLVFRLPSEKRLNQPWQKSTYSPALSATWQQGRHTGLYPIIRAQTAREVVMDMLMGDSKSIYLSVDMRSKPKTTKQNTIDSENYVTPMLPHRPSLIPITFGKS